MIHLTANTTIYLATQPVDFRKQIDGLVSLCQRHLQHNPRNGALYAFTNRARTMIRILHYDGTGYWLATKRLSQGRYHGWPAVTANLSATDAIGLKKIIQASIENTHKIN